MAGRQAGQGGQGSEEGGDASKGPRNPGFPWKPGFSVETRVYPAGPHGICIMPIPIPYILLPTINKDTERGRTMGMGSYAVPILHAL
jgi:hypothetical protein